MTMEGLSPERALRHFRPHKKHGDAAGFLKSFASVFLRSLI